MASSAPDTRSSRQRPMASFFANGVVMEKAYQQLNHLKFSV